MGALLFEFAATGQVPCGEKNAPNRGGPARLMVPNELLVQDLVKRDVKGLDDDGVEGRGAQDERHLDHDGG